MPQQEAAEAISRMNPNAVDHALFKRVYFATYDDPGFLVKHADHILHVHNKCWHMTESCEEPSIDNENVVRLLKESGYDGYIATEFEGQRYFHDVGCGENADEIEEVRRNQEMLKRLLGE